MDIFTNNHLSPRHLTLDIERGEDAFDYLISQLNDRQKQEMDSITARLANLYIGKTIEGVKIAPEVYKLLLTRAVNRFDKQKTILSDNKGSLDEKNIFEVLSGILQIELIGYSIFDRYGNRPNYRTSMDVIYRAHFNGDFISEGENFAENMAEIHDHTFNSENNTVNLTTIAKNIDDNILGMALGTGTQERNVASTTQVNTAQSNENPRANPNRNETTTSRTRTNLAFAIVLYTMPMSVVFSVLTAMADYANRHPEAEDHNEDLRPDSRFNRVVGIGVGVSAVINLTLFAGLTLRYRARNSRAMRSLINHNNNSIELNSLTINNETPSREQSTDGLLTRFRNSGSLSATQNRVNSGARNIIRGTNPQRGGSDRPSTSRGI